MAKAQKKLQKNMKKVKENQKKEYPLKNQVMYFSKIIFTLIVLSIFIYGITVISNKSYKLEDSKLNYDNSEILAGQTFSKLDEEYYVVFYDFGEESSVTTAINNVSGKIIYKVDLSLGNNKNIVAEQGNTDASSADELKINGTTIIKVMNGNNAEYIEGTDNVLKYLEEM